jgi:Ni,Fe-hydrogenase I small subunit
MRIVGSQAGEQYFNELQQFLISTGSPPPEVPYLLIVNGAVPVSGSGVVGKRACYIASDSTGAGYSGDAITIYDAVREVARGMAVQSNSDSVIRAAIAWGTCSSFGGVPAARNGKYSPGAANEYQSTGASALTTALDSTGVPSGEVFDPLGQGTIVPVLNLAGCCPNPNTLYLVAAHYIVQVLLGSSALGNLLDVDAEGRPKKAAGVNLFRNTIHGLNCPRYEYYTAGVFATKPGDPGCLALLGCRGIFTYAPCYQSDGTTNKQPYWNDQMTACITQGVPCQGCHEKGFPDKMAPIIFY